MSEKPNFFVAESTDGNGNLCFELVIDEPVSVDKVKKLLECGALTPIKVEFRFTTDKPDDDVKKARLWLADKIGDLKESLQRKQKEEVNK